MERNAVSSSSAAVVLVVVSNSCVESKKLSCMKLSQVAKALVAVLFSVLLLLLLLRMLLCVGFACSCVCGLVFRRAERAADDAAATAELNDRPTQAVNVTAVLCRSSSASSLHTPPASPVLLASVILHLKRDSHQGFLIILLRLLPITSKVGGDQEIHLVI